MAGITDYRLGLDPGIPGTIATAYHRCDIRMKYNASATVLAYGRAVVQTTGAVEAVTNPTGSLKDFVGIVVRTYMFEDAETADGASGWPAKKQIDVLCGGDIFVEVEQAVAPGDPVYFRFAASEAVGTPTLTVVGKFRKTADTVSTVDSAVLVPRARFLSSTTGAGIAKLTLNLP